MYRRRQWPVRPHERAFILAGVRPLASAQRIRDNIPGVRILDTIVERQSAAKA